MENIIIGSLILSILQSILFWHKKPGISVAIFVTALVAYFCYILKKNKKIENKRALIMTIPIVLLSLTYFIYNNIFFQIINSIVIIILFIIMTMYLTKTKVKMPQFISNSFKIVIGAVESIDEIVQYFKKPRNKIEDDKKEKIGKVVKSLIIISPIIIIVLILLSSADVVFGNLFSGITSWFKGMLSGKEIMTFVSRILYIIIIFLYIAGYIFNLIKEDTLYTKQENNKSKSIQIENLTINMIVTILNIIYAIFCTIQFTNLFTHIGNNANLNYAEYARQGFFQLMIVSFINFAIILVTSINKKEKTTLQIKYQKIMNILLIIFTVIIIISAFFRMNLYEQKFGYTYLRLFVYYILITEIIYMVPLVLYILGKKIDLLKSAIAIITTIYLILNFSNIDYVIAKKNVDRYFENEVANEIDFKYLFINTGTDAIEQIERLTNSNDEIVKESAKAYLYRTKESLKTEKTNWQEFNLSKWKAIKKLEQMNIRNEVKNEGIRE